MPQWIDSPIVTQRGYNLVSQMQVDMVSSFLGYYGEPDGSGPPSGIPYRAHMVIGVDNPGTGHVDIQTEVWLPSSTQFLHPTRIRCYLTAPDGRLLDVTADPAAACIQQPTLSGIGAWNLGLRRVPAFHLFLIEYDLISTATVHSPMVGGVTSYLGQARPQVLVRIP